MSITRLPRELGIIIRCDGTDTTSCGNKIQTANVRAKVNRKSAAGQGWGRGLRKSRKRHDHCPEHMKVERELFAKERTEREAELKRRGELKKAKFAPKPPKERKPRKSSATPTPTSSPSAVSAPALAT